jgi:hypothetical protein
LKTDKNMDYISLKVLSEMIGINRSQTRKMVLKMGYKPQKRRMPDSGNQLALVFSSDEVNSILKYREDLGFTKIKPPIINDMGYFYIIQVIPELDSSRIKMGFATNMMERLANHRTIAPTAKIFKTWPCKRIWEITVMDCLSSISCKHILNEVFECRDLEELIKKGDSLFKMLPGPGSKIELSINSPLKEYDAKTL